MIEFLKWMFSGFWIFLGMIILIGVVLDGLATIVRNLRR